MTDTIYIPMSLSTWLFNFINRHQIYRLTDISPDKALEIGEPLPAYRQSPFSLIQT